MFGRFSGGGLEGLVRRPKQTGFPSSWKKPFLARAPGMGQKTWKSWNKENQSEVHLNRNPSLTPDNASNPLQLGPRLRWSALILFIPAVKAVGTPVLLYKTQLCNTWVLFI